MPPAPDSLVGGVETGGTKVVCLLGRGPEEILAQERFATTTPAETIDRIIAFFAAHEPPRVIGVGAFGPVGVNPTTADWGVLANTPKPGWRGVALGPEIRRRTGVEVVLDTDVNAAALAEVSWGAGRGCQSLAYLTVGTGIGAGIVLDGRPVHGLLHPEAGHMRIPHDLRADAFAGSCPFHGDCWEGLASGSAMTARWGVPGAELGVDHPGWELEASYLAAGITNIITVVSPERCVIGGGVLSHPGLLGRVRDEVRALLGGYLEPPGHASDLADYLVPPQLGSRAGALGAMALAQTAG